MATENANLRTALTQWRDSLVNLTGRNRLLNYRPTRSSTIEFTRASSAEVHATIASSRMTFVTGTRPPESPIAMETNSEPALEDLVLDEMASFSYENYPDSLFADLTQRNVDRALKTMAGVARREYLDKGLSTLYLALGALRWIDDSGDSRRSPLILLPASLESAGPRQPLSLTFSADDMSVNPALAIKLAEYAIELPSSESVIEGIDSGGIATALAMFFTMQIPDEWSIEDFSTLSNFMFAKEAMYRDLLDNEERILGHPTLIALAGATASEKSLFAFDEVQLDDVDLAAPPESTPLILDADASQRAAVLAANAGKSFVMDGPPGTGKSQTIANMIGTLVNQGKSVLFVSEKIVALEVVRDRLASRGLDPFTLELHSHNAVRSEVARRLGAAVQMRPVAPAKPTPEHSEQVRAAREKLSDYASAMNEVRQPLELSMFEVLGRMTALNPRLTPPPSPLPLDMLNPSSLTKLIGKLESLGRNWNRALEGERALWARLQKQPGSVFDFRLALESLQALKALEPATAEAATALGLEGLQSVRRLHELLVSWHGHAQPFRTTWLSGGMAPLSRALETYARLLQDLEDAESAAEQSTGTDWRTLPSSSLAPPDGHSLWGHLNIERGELTVARLATATDYLRRANSLLGTTQESSRVLCVHLGLPAPTTPTTYRAHIDAAAILLGDAPPLMSWLTDARVRVNATEGLTQLKQRVEDEREAEEGASVAFTEAVLALDLDVLFDALPLNASLLKRLRREYRASRASVLATAQSTVDAKQISSMLPLAVRWRDARRALAESVTQYAEALGSYFAGRDTDWDKATRAVRGAESIAETVRILDEPALTSVLVSRPSRAQLRPIHDDLVASFAQWSELESTDGDVLIPLTAAESLASTAEIFKLLTADAEFLTRTLGVFTSHLGPQVTVHIATDAVATRVAADSAKRLMNGMLPEISKTLDLSPGELPDSTAGLSDFTDHLEWVRLFRALRADDPSSPALAPADVAALQNSYLPGALTAAIDDWEQRRTSILDLFEPRRQAELAEDLADMRTGEELLTEFVHEYDSAEEWLALHKTMSELREFGLRAALDYAVSTRLSADDISDYLMKSVYEAWFGAQMKSDSRLELTAAIDRDTLAEKFRELDRQLGDAAISTIVESATRLRPRTTTGQAGIVLREAEKKRKHIAVRELVSRARDVIQAVHPCFMMSPLAVSQYLPPDIEFDVVIFDEASQVSPGDAINCVYRGKALITVGDQKQLPPTSFFTSTDDIDEDSDEENLAADYESILDLMKASGSFNSLTLRWHYRSRHEDLISYSNASFYDGRLITFPGAIADSERYGVKFHRVEGVYRRSAGRDNPIEAEYVAQRVLHHFDKRPEASLGVVAFSSTQRDTIENAITLARAGRPDLDGYFQDDRIDGFFVKSLESVQGDERDAIIFSIGYGPDETGKFYKQFGPVNMTGGQRRLNVAVTRARELVEIVSSFSSAEIGEVKSEGARHLRRYLDFAERGPAALALELGPSGLGTDSPFEDAVIESIRSWGFDVQPQVGVAGYRIDIGVKHPNFPGAFMLGVECDGAMYHSSRTARDRDRLRHEILEGLGWTLHHIWGTAWYRNRAREEQRLRNLLEELAEEPVTTRVAKPRVSVSASPIVLDVEEDEMDAIPSWVIDYLEAQPERIPSWLDLSQHGGHRHLVGFVRAIVEIEAPVHIDLVAQRLRASSGIGRLGARIQANLRAAIAHVGASFDGQFLRASDDRPIAVRRPSVVSERTVEQVAPEELAEAILGVVRDARGISAEQVAAHVAGIFGWRRRGSTIAGQLQAMITTLCEEGKLVRTPAGLRIAD